MLRTAFSLACLFVCLGTAAAALPPQRAVLDFDGDNRTDYLSVRNESGTLNWYLQQSMAGFRAQAWGAAGDTYVPADYDGDQKWDIAIWRPGTPAHFYILQSMTGTLCVVPFGTTNDFVFETQDFDGDGMADPTVVRNVNNVKTWYILQSTAGLRSVQFGANPFDYPVRGDYDGDGKADVAVYRISENTFYVLRSSDGGLQAQTFGDIFTDYIVPADFDGDGKTDYAVWRGAGSGTDGMWYWRQSSDGAFRALPFGTGGSSAAGDLPVPGDYDGDGRTDQAIYRRGVQSVFYVNGSTAGFSALAFGLGTDFNPPAFGLQVR